MNKYVLAMVVLGFLGFHGFKRLKRSYQLPFENAPAQQAPSADTSAFERAPKKRALNDDPSEVFYHLNVDRFADGDAQNNVMLQKQNPLGFHGGDIQGLIGNFEHVKSLGVTAILLDPLTKQSDRPRKYKNDDGTVLDIFPFSGDYQVDPSSIDPRFGTPDQLMKLSQLAKSKNIKVFVTLDLKFVMPDSSLVKDSQSAKFFLPEDIPACNLRKGISTGCSFGGRRVFDQKGEESVKYLIDVAKSWARYGVDGIFLKWVNFYDPEFVYTLKTSLKSVFGEDFKVANQAGLPFKRLLSKDYNDYRVARPYPSVLLNYLNEDVEFKSFFGFLESFLKQVEVGQIPLAPTKEDMGPSLPYKVGDDLKILPTSLALILASGLSPIINFGEEVGKIDSGIPFYRTDFPWGDKSISPGAGLPQDEWVLAEYKKLIALKKDQQNMFEGGIRAVPGDFSEKTFCLELHTEDTVNSLSCFNFSGSPKNIKVRVPNNWKDRSSLTDHVGERSLEVKGNSIAIDLDDYGAAIVAP